MGYRRRTSRTYRGIRAGQLFAVMRGMDERMDAAQHMLFPRIERAGSSRLLAETLADIKNKCGTPGTRSLAVIETAPGQFANVWDRLDT